MKITTKQLKQIIKEELESTNENNSRLSRNHVHILFKAAPGENRRHIVGVFSGPEKYEKWFRQRRLDDPDFNMDDYDLVAYAFDPS